MRDFFKRHKSLIFVALAALLCVLIACIEPPAALTREAMIYLGALTALILLLVTQAVPDYIAVLAALGVVVTAGVSDFETAFRPFSQTTLWMMFLVFCISGTLVKTTLLQRFISFAFRILPRNYTGAVLMLILVGTLLVPMMPVVSFLTPCAFTLAEGFGFKKGDKGSRGLFAAMYVPSGIVKNAFYSTSGMGLVSLGIAGIVDEFTWLSYFSVTWGWLAAVTVLMVAAILLCYAPRGVKKQEQESASLFADKLPKMTKEDWIVAAVLCLTLLGWITESLHGVPPVLVALFGVAALSVAGVFQVKDLARIPWKLIIFIGGLLSIASMMGRLGVDKWIGSLLSPLVSLFTGNLFVYIAFVCILTYLLRYVVFSQLTAFSIVYLTLAPTASGVGMAPVVLMLIVLGATCVWSMPCNNTSYLGAMGAKGDAMVDHRDTLPMCYMFMAVHIAACFICVPLWQAMGLIF